MDILIKNVTAVTMDEPAVIHGAFIGISGGKICFLGTGEPAEPAARVIDGHGMIAMPGFVNAHTHVSMSILRGYADDYDLHTWLHEHVFPAEAKMDSRCIKAGALLGIAEMIRTGTIAMTDMYSKITRVAEAAFQAGIYANISNGAISFDPIGYDFENDNVTREMREMLEKWHNIDGGRIVLDTSIHAEYTSFDRLWRANTEFAAQHGLRMHVHVSETEREHNACVEKYGRTPVEVLAASGVFDVPSTAAHCVWVTDGDIELLAEKGATVAHNPISNLKLASGIARVPKMLEMGVNVALGTDSVCSNNSIDMFEEIKTCALLQKGITRDASAIPAAEALEMATVRGAQGQGRAGSIGRLAAGYDASLILVNASAPGLTPVHNPVSTLAYSARGGDVCLTMVRGKVLYENGVYHTIDLEALRHELDSYVMPRVFGA